MGFIRLETKTEEDSSAGIRIRIGKAVVEVKALQDPPEQLWLFNEAECHADETKPDEPEPEETVTVSAHERKRGHRQALPEALPLYDRLYADVVSGHVLHMDETRVQVLKEKDRADERISTLF